VRATLPNGLRVVVVRNTLAPVVATELNYRVGADETPDGFPGMAHAQEHMMFRGSPGLSATQLADINAAVGGDFDADTRQTVTQYYYLVPSEDLDLALHVESVRMRGVLDTDSLWSRERGAIEQEVASDLSNPQYVFYTRLRKAMFAGTPYAHDGLGTRPSFDKTTGNMLKRFHDEWYAPNNAILVVVGDVDPSAVVDSVRALFGDIPSKQLPPRPKVEPGTVRPDTLRLPTDLPYGLSVVAFRMPGSGSPDYAAAQVLSDVLSSERGALYGLVPAGKALYAGFQTETMPAAGIGMALGVFARGQSGDSLLATVSSTLQQEVSAGLSADLVEAAKRDELTGAESRKNSAFGLANAWSEAVAVEGRTSPAQDLDAMERVTVEDVDRVARKYLDPAHAVVAVLTPQPSGKPVSSKGFGGKESFTPKGMHETALPDWARAALGRLSVPHSTLHPVVDTLSNGIRLVVQHESVSRIVSVYGRIKTNPDLETDSGKEGVGRVLGQLFDYGTATLDRKAFQKALDDIGANESAGTGFSLTVLGSHFDRGVQLLADNERHPALPEHAFQVVRAQTAQALGGELQSPDYLFGRALSKALLPANDPALREATPATVSSLSLDDVKAYYGKVFRPDMTTIVVVGNVDPDTARAVITRYFGDWTASGPRPETDLASIPANGPDTIAVPDKSRVQDQVVLAETLGLTRSDSDYYALELGNHVLGGGFYATRLYHDLREEAGLVYSVGSSFDIGKIRSTYEVDYACDPPNVSKARTMIVRDLEAMQQSPVTPHELQQAKAMVLREIPLSESSEGSIAGGLLGREMEGLPLDEPTRAARRYLAIDAAEIQAAFARWLRPGDLVQVSEGPTPK
jgi:zinc protease